MYPSTVLLVQGCSRTQGNGSSLHTNSGGRLSSGGGFPPDRWSQWSRLSHLLYPGGSERCGVRDPESVERAKVGHVGRHADRRFLRRPSSSRSCCTCAGAPYEKMSCVSLPVPRIRLAVSPLTRFLTPSSSVHDTCSH